MKSASEIISLWPSAEHFAADIGLKYPSHGRLMKMRGRIPDRHWDAVLDAAHRRSIDVSREDLQAANAPISPAPAEAGAAS